MIKICNIEGCNRKHLAKGMCRKHYLRMYKNGTSETIVRPSDISTYDWLIKNSSFNESGCLLYNGKLTPTGYVHIRTEDNGPMRFGHVIVFEHEKGKIPDGLEISHSCHVRNCLNINHLEAVTHKENIQSSIMIHGNYWGFGSLSEEERKEQARSAANTRWNNS